ncbi:protein fem-1 homolog B-like isoform X3 [Oratosquilla oratoria]|uniref:protein fem-1 homolog B-like isoform X3 n=1 Tax=Oratosquilla oratoria TaxID=337810 RepID=UPI003F77812B
MSGKQDQMKIKVFHASKEGMSLSLYALLSVESEEKCRDLLSQVVEEDGQKCTPLLIAARNGHEKAVRTILKFSPDLEQEATVKFDGYVIEGASPLWCASAKPKVPPISAYDYHVECQTVEELEAIRHVSASLHMESLAIRERILGPHNPEVPHPVIFRGAVFADNARFDRCLQLWLHALRLKQSNKVSVVKDLLRFAQVFSQMLHVGVELEFLPVHEVLEATVLELERDKEKIHSPGPKDDVDTIKDELESNMVTGLYLIMIAVRVAKGRMANSSSNKIVPTEQTRHTIGDNEAKVHQTVYKLVRSNATTRAGHSLLHLAVNPDTPVDDFHTNHVCKFPCATTAKLLITCGASVNAMDANRNTPLHLIVSYQKPISDFLTLHSIIMALIEGGAHMDTVNQMGATPFDSATTGVAEIILRTQKKLNLKCLAAKVVKIHGIPYKGQVPTHLEAFIELHGPGHVDGLGQRSKNPEQQHL